MKQQDGRVGVVAVLGSAQGVRQVNRGGSAKAAACIVTCHNYGRFLGQCLETILAQTRKFAEVVVVDDRSDDDTAAVCQGFPGVKYLRVEFGDVNPSRNAGLAATTSPIVLHVDADNWLGETYLETMLPLLYDPHVGIASSAPIICNNAGETMHPAQWAREFDYWHLRRENHMDTCSLLRREAIEQAGGWKCPVRVLEDWHLWLRITGDGWKAVTTSYPAPLTRGTPPSKGGEMEQTTAIGEWFYRLHDTRASVVHRADGQEGRYAVMRDVYHVAVIVPFSGREFSREKVIGNLTRLGWPEDRLHGIFVDNSCDIGFGVRLRESLHKSCHKWQSVTIIRDDTRAIAAADNATLANSADLRVTCGNRMTDAISRLYAREAQRLLGPRADLVLTIEDDIEILGAEIIPRLLGGLQPDVMAVSGTVRSRFEQDGGVGRPIAYATDSETPYAHHLLPAAGGTGLQQVGGTGMGCLLTRAEAWHRYLPRRTSVNDDGKNFWHDVAFAADVRRMSGLKWLLDWDVTTKHWQEDGSYA